MLSLEGKATSYVYGGVFGDNLVVIYSGQYVKYGKLIPNKKKTKKSKDTMDLVLQKTDGKYLKDMNAYFSQNQEVIQVI